jgi:Holliday junction resolvase RusA-like endonuclease
MDELEMSTLAFTVYGDPKGQPRPRAFARKIGAIHVARFYDSDVADTWKRQVMLAIMQAAEVGNGWHFTSEAVSVSMNFAMPRPKSHSGAKGLKPSAPVAHAGKPDVDNLAKLILDQITRSGNVWRDDSQVVSLTVHKFWAVGAEQGCSVSISTLGI